MRRRSVDSGSWFVPAAACGWLLVIWSLSSAMPRMAWAAEVNLEREIRSLLSDRCFPCHGPDAERRQADLRLDVPEGMFSERDGLRTVVPGEPGKSELYRRVVSADATLRMPPPEAGNQLDARQTELIRRWIERGATWQGHWSLVPPRRLPLPDIHQRDWPRHPIDTWVLDRLEQEDLAPSPDETDRARLLRRVTLDLTGLPPTPEEVEQFLRDESPNAYERVVDRLLASPRFGERQAMDWLDLARYADTDGYQDDEPRVMWRWREWVIDALNDNLPFDQFTIEQLAGDLLPGATAEQKLATGFHRNHRVNGEGGSIEEEFRVEYVFDRVDTTATVWLGLTLACARCHDHKYDPLTQRDYYGLFAFFNNVPEKGTYRGNGAPLIKAPSRIVRRQLDDLQQRWEAAGQEEPLRKALEAQREQLLETVPTTMVMEEGPPRETFLLRRGQYDQPGERVNAATPASLPEMSAEMPRNRLGLARWLVEPSHPLTARVAVNRCWQTHFGRGLVATAEDWGVQGDPPSHPELLDWLACELIQLGWDMKRLHRELVTSAVYRQSSRIQGTDGQRDPDNRWLARFPRVRLPAELIRDQALAAARLLEGRLGGPSVKPYQPAGIWDEIAGGTTSKYKDGYQQDRGADLYRRSIYTFWRRTIPPPSMVTFDAPSRERCTVRRPLTDTPLQALALLNDITYVEAARALAERMLDEGGSREETRLRHGFRCVLAREPSPVELDALRAGYERYRARFTRDAAASKALSSAGEARIRDGLNQVELAALTAVASVILNLDETLTRE